MTPLSPPMFPLEPTRVPPAPMLGPSCTHACPLREPTGVLSLLPPVSPPC